MVSREMLLDFFLTFARFEYAMKASTFMKPAPPAAEEPVPAKPDWNRLTETLEGRFDPGSSIELQEACRYLLEAPPRRQMTLGEGQFWQPPARGGESEIRYLLSLVRIVRNNLFHGGKHNLEVHEDEARTELLLRNSLTVLAECRALSAELARAFDEAVL
jgi:hypothetical protein